MERKERKGCGERELELIWDKVMNTGSLKIVVGYDVAPSVSMHENTGMLVV